MAKTKVKRMRLEYIEAGSLTANPANWRRHPDHQVAAIRQVLDDPEIGWAGACLWNERTQRLVDGHARSAAVDPSTPIPVLIGDWSEAAEKKILLTLDPLANLAVPDDEKLNALLDSTEFDGALKEMADSLRVDDLDTDAKEKSRTPGQKDAVAKIKAVFAVLDAEFVERAIAMTGIDCRGEALVSICRDYAERQQHVRKKSGAAA